MVRRPARLAAALLALSFVLEAAAPQKAALPPTYQKWLEQEVVYIIKPLERDVFLKLQSDRERDLFIEAFWKPPRPQPRRERERVQDGTLPADRPRQQVFREVGAAPRLEDRPGPDLHHPRRAGDIQRFTGTQGVYPAEVWFYQDKNEPRPRDRIQPPVLPGARGRGLQALQPGRRRSPGPPGRLYRQPFRLRQAAYEQLQKLVPRRWPRCRCRSSRARASGPGGRRSPRTCSSRRSRTCPETLVEEKYAQKFLEFKDVVEVEYSANYLDSDSLVHVLRDPGGLYFVHYAVEPRRLAVAAVRLGL